MSGNKDTLAVSDVSDDDFILDVNAPAVDLEDSLSLNHGSNLEGDF